MVLNADSSIQVRGVLSKKNPCLIPLIEVWMEEHMRYPCINRTRLSIDYVIVYRVKRERSIRQINFFNKIWRYRCPTKKKLVDSQVVNDYVCVKRIGIL